MKKLSPFCSTITEFSDNVNSATYRKIYILKARTECVIVSQVLNVFPHINHNNNWNVVKTTERFPPNGFVKNLVKAET